MASTAVGGDAGMQLGPQQLEAVFVSACFNGSVTLGPAQQTPIAFQDLPKDLRRRFGPYASGEVWRLNASTPTYLYIIKFTVTPTTSPKVCGLATKSLNMEPAIEFLGNRVNGPSLKSFHERYSAVEWLDAPAGYIVAATQVRRFTVLEVKALSADERKRALEGVRALGVDVRH
jgi:hypothetical protein